MNFDAVVVGGGPVGSTVAEAIAKDGYDVLILEEHPQIGLPQHCTGKISVNASKELGLPEIGALQEVRGAIFYSPDMNFLKVERKETKAHIFDRVILDKRLLERAVDAGAALLTTAQAVNVTVDGRCVNILFKHEGELRHLASRVVISADGASAPLARLLGMYSKKRNMLRIAVQREMTGLRNLEPELVELYLGRQYAPGFFAWIVPTGKDSAKVGLCVEPSQSKHLLNYMEKFIGGHPIACKKLREGSCVGQRVHIIPTGGTLRQTVSEGILIVGDAAGQVKSTTGGGLYYGMVCAKIAGRVVSKALSSGKDLLLKEDLAEYQSLWQERLGREIAMNAKTRLLLDSLTDEELNYLFQIIRGDEALINLIETEGDIDWQFKLSKSVFKHVINALARRPQLLLKLGTFIIK